jgi:hypothetical protein
MGRMQLRMLDHWIMTDRRVGATHAVHALRLYSRLVAGMESD